MTYDELLEEMRGGKSHMFIHGGAGSGKSELIHKMQTHSSGIIYAAPSGIAALNNKGVTIHSVFNLKPTVQNANEMIKIKDEEKIEAIKNADTLLIDEISMVRCDLFDKIDSSLRKIRENTMPFWGVRIILVGDLFQLGPVANTQDQPYLIKYGYSSDNFEFFNSMAWNNSNFISRLRFYELNHNFRQAEDRTFGAILSSIRLGLCDMKKLAIINKRVATHCDDRCHYLTIRNETAQSINKSRLLRLPGNQYESVPFIEPISMIDNQSVKKCPINQVLTIKRNMKVMFVMNDSAKNGKRWVNGTIGFLVGITLGKNNYIESVAIDINGKNYDVSREYYEIYSPFYYNGLFGAKCIARIFNFPFVAAWASTIDKCQGLTLDKVFIDFEEKAFRPGQAYVALSRARSLRSISLNRPITPEDVHVSPSIKQFYQDISKKIMPVTYDPNEIG
jgi:hypothetical protein